MICESLRIKVLEIARKLPDYGLVWMAGGTVIARDVETDYVVVTPSGMPYSELKPEDISVTDIDNKVIDGLRRPSVALDLWTGILRARPEINGIVHTHSPYATAFSVINESIPIITETQADWFDQPIPVAPYFHLEDKEFFTLPVKVLGSGFAVILGQHGVITIGETLEHALERAVTIEEAAQTFAIANMIGKPLIFTDAMAKRSFDYYHHRYGQNKLDQ